MKKDINELSREINDFMLDKLSQVKTKDALEYLIEHVQKEEKRAGFKIDRIL